MEIEEKTISQLKDSPLCEVIPMGVLGLVNIGCLLWWLITMFNGDWMKSLAIAVPVCLYNCVSLLARINRKIR